MGEKGNIIEVEQTRSIIDHFVVNARVVVLEANGVMVVLVKCLLPTNSCGRGGGCHQAFVGPVEYGKIVGPSLSGMLPKVVALCSKIVVQVGPS